VFGAGEMGWTELHSAAGDNDLDTIRRLVQAKADINERDGAGLTALHVAAGESNKEAIQVLCELGADSNIKATFDEATPLHKAVTVMPQSCDSHAPKS